MTIHIKSVDFPILVMDNFLTDEELKNVFNELYELKINPLISSNTDAAKKDHKFLTKNKSGAWLDRIFQGKREKCEYFKVYKKYLGYRSREFDDFLNVSDLSASFLDTKIDSTLFGIYANESSYESHNDVCHFTQIFWLTEDEDYVDGGNLVFTNLDLEIKFKNNRLILFPAFCKHEVTNTKLMKSNVYRYSYTTFFHLY